MKKKQNLLLIDDEVNILNSLKRLLEKENYHIFTAISAYEGISCLKNHEIGVVVSDLMMPGMDGLTLFEQVKQTNHDVVQILLTGKTSIDTTIKAINRLQLFGYLTKPWLSDELKNMIYRAFNHYNLVCENRILHKLRAAQNETLKKINSELEERVRQRTGLLDDAMKEGIMMLATAAEEKDKTTGEHIFRIRNMTMEICRAMGMEESKSEEIGFFSITHDVGKIHIPDAILNKPGPLDDTEWQIMKNHTVIGEKILGNKPFYAVARQIARSHHENWDGSGYPDGVKGEEIPISARIVSIADVFDALVNTRPYKEKWSRKTALKEIKRMSGKKFDPFITDIFISIEESGIIHNSMSKEMHMFLTFSI